MEWVPWLKRGMPSDRNNRRRIMARVAQPAQPSQDSIVASWILFEVAQSACINASVANACGPIRVGRKCILGSTFRAERFREKLVVPLN